MCGIAGIAAPDGPDLGALEAMSAALEHRGPDAHGLAENGPVALAARRLAIIDLQHGDQPIETEDGRVTVVQNGEIYNHEALREELRGAGHAFTTRCDTEVLGHAYEQHGVEMLGRLRGMFALALWDRRDRTLVLARDAFGIKPLFYAPLAGGGLAFASELTALMRHPGVSRELDPDELVVRPDAAELLPRIAAAADEPLGDSSMLPTYLVSELASQHVKVVLSGEGGDELFGGYETYAADLLAARIGRAAAALEPLARVLPSSDRRGSLHHPLKRLTPAAPPPPPQAHPRR